jgi:UDPglucose 6-dehydrogenase
MDAAAHLLSDVHYCVDAYDTMADADALVIITEWNEFRALDLARVRAAMKAPVMIDMRNIYEPRNMAEAGFSYHSLGRPLAGDADA